MIAPGRNSPCPCGSGKRFKDCHGALAPSVDALAGERETRRRLDTALAAQQAGRFAEAIALYEDVNAKHPGNFDALHMLGVVHYQRGDFDRAHALLISALAIRPGDAGARYNMELVEGALENRVIERTICAETLPRLAKRCIAAPAPGDRRRWQGTALDVIGSNVEMRDGWGEVRRLVRWLGAEATFWSYRQSSAPTGTSLSLRVIDPGAATLPQQRAALFYGTEISPATWYPQAPATEIALFCDTYDACALSDRIPELAREGRTPLHMLFASPALARRTGLPGQIVDPWDAG